MSDIRGQRAISIRLSTTVSDNETARPTCNEGRRESSRCFEERWASRDGHRIYRLGWLCRFRLETVGPGRMRVGKIDMSYLVETYLSVCVCACVSVRSVCV